MGKSSFIIKSSVCLVAFYGLLYPVKCSMVGFLVVLKIDIFYYVPVKNVVIQ